jgi:hypothetical protein
MESSSLSSSSHLASLNMRHGGITECKKLERKVSNYGITSTPNLIHFRPAILKLLNMY